MKSTVAFFPRSLNHHDLDDWKPTKTNKFLSGLHKTSLIEKIYMKYCNMCRLCINIKLFFFSSFFSCSQGSVANKFYVHNDIFCYEDEVFGDSEAELDEGEIFMSDFSFS